MRDKIKQLELELSYSKEENKVLKIKVQKNESKEEAYIGRIYELEQDLEKKKQEIEYHYNSDRFA